MNEITIDCALIHSRTSFHEAFSLALSFPEWYGKNLDALNDCLTAVHEDTKLHLLHWDTLEANLGPYAANAKKVILHAASANPKFAVTFI